MTMNEWCAPVLAFYINAGLDKVLSWRKWQIMIQNDILKDICVIPIFAA